MSGVIVIVFSAAVLYAFLTMPQWLADGQCPAVDTDGTRCARERGHTGHHGALFVPFEEVDQ